MMHIVRNKHTRGWTGGESVPGVLHCAVRRAVDLSWGGLRHGGLLGDGRHGRRDVAPPKRLLQDDRANQ